MGKVTRVNGPGPEVSFNTVDYYHQDWRESPYPSHCILRIEGLGVTVSCWIQ